MSHLLSLSALHAAAPGVLDIVFGADGDFEGAPLWVPAGWAIHPMLFDPDYMPKSGKPDWPHLWVPGHGWAFRPFEEIVLDCRQPSVAAQLAGLCARALMGHLSGAISVECGVQDVRLGFVWGPPLQAAFTIWTHDGRCIAGHGPTLPPHHLGQYDTAEFLAALTLALAPKIAALGGPRV